MNHWRIGTSNGSVFLVGLLRVFYVVMFGVAVLVGVPLLVASFVLAGLGLIVLVEVATFKSDRK